MDSDEAYTKILKALTPQQKYDASMNLYWSARELKAAWLRSIHADWSEAQIQQSVREAFLYAGD